MKTARFFIITFILIPFVNSNAQNDTSKTKVLVITLKDNTEYVCVIESNESKFLNILTLEKNKIRILKDDIREVVSYEDSDFLRRQNAASKKAAEKIDTTLINYSDENLNRLIIFPTARALKPWHGYVQLNELLFPFAAIGIGNFLTLGGGISLLPGAERQIYYFSPKVTALHSENLDAAAGIFYMSQTKADKLDLNQGLGIIYTMTTLGDTEKNLSFGLGWGFSGENYSQKPIIILGGDLKIGRNFKLLAETWTPVGANFTLVMLGFRVIGKHITGDAAILTPLNKNAKGGSFAPWFSLTYNFGN